MYPLHSGYMYQWQKFLHISILENQARVSLYRTFSYMVPILNNNFYILSLTFMWKFLCLETWTSCEAKDEQYCYSNYGTILYKGSITRALTKKKHEWSYERCSNNNKDLLKPHSEDSKQKTSGTINTIICQVTEKNDNNSSPLACFGYETIDNQGGA